MTERRKMEGAKDAPSGDEPSDSSLQLRELGRSRL
jgi:hypothetical protein